jgi:hypothetical protein
MKLVKSLLLASAAGFAAVSGASAADLGAKVTKPAPAEYVRICNAYGAGFFFIPGTQTCLKVGGTAFFDYGYGQTYARGANATGTRGGGALILDARTQSEYGPVRAFFRISGTRRIGNQRSGTGFRIGIAEENPPGGGGVDFQGKAQTQISVDAAFVQMGGLTAGRLASFFDLGFGGGGLIATAGSGLTTQMLAYTATFGSGFSATIAIEDAIEPRQRIFGSTAIAVTTPALAAPFSVFTPNYDNTRSYYGGSSVPDVVAAIRVDQAWGSAQLSGVVHQINYNLPANATTFGNPSADYGYAIQAGVKINLPMLAAGDSFNIYGNYSHGALSRTISNLCGQGSDTQCGTGNNFTTGNLPAFDAAASIAPNRQYTTKLTDGYLVGAGITHFWTPTISQQLFGSWQGVRYASVTGLPSYNIWSVGTQVTWSPIAGLRFIGEVQYNNYQANRRYLNGGVAAFSAANFTVGNGTTFVSRKKTEDQIVLRARIQRDF